MVRGCEKRIYYVKNPDSEIFDEAYLILKRQGEGRRASPREVELEAARILRSASNSRGGGDRTRLRAFLCGALVSAAFIGIVSLLITLLI